MGWGVLVVDPVETMSTTRVVCLKEAALSSCRFVSDHGLDGYNGVCQRKLLTAMKQMESYPGESRAFPPTQLEWTTNQRKGKMVLDVYTYKGNCWRHSPHHPACASGSWEQELSTGYRDRVP